MLKSSRQILPDVLEGRATVTVPVSEDTLEALAAAARPTEGEGDPGPDWWGAVAEQAAEVLRRWAADRGR